jgi:hypothetical protein
MSLAALSLAFRLPALLNARGGVNSDVSIVGLQAMHVLQGEWSLFLWGSDYQSSVDAVIAAAWFLLVSSKPLALVLSTVFEHTLLTLTAYATLRRRFAPWTSVLACLPLVFTTEPVHTNVLHPPRQAALTLVFVALWLVDGAPESRRPALGFGLGALVLGLACFADPISFVFVPALALLALLAWRATVPYARRGALASAGLGTQVGLLPDLLLLHTNKSATRVLSVTREVVSRNLQLALEQCLPFALGARVYYSPNDEPPRIWRAPAAFSFLQWAGAALLIAAVVAAGVLAYDRRRPAGERRLGAFGCAMGIVTTAAFLLSPMVSDLYSARYFAPALLSVPFALAPVLGWLGPRRTSLGLAPYLVSAATAGWLELGSDVEGWRIRLDNARARDEHALHALLDARGIRYAMADYWTAYRLTLLYEEHPIVVPLHRSQDRHLPYRDAFAAEPVVAYIYDPRRSEEDFALHEARIRGGATEWEPRPEHLDVGRFSVLILTRKGSSPRIAKPGAPAKPPAQHDARASDTKT